MPALALIPWWVVLGFVALAFAALSLALLWHWFRYFSVPRALAATLLYLAVGIALLIAGGWVILLYERA